MKVKSVRFKHYIELGSSSNQTYTNNERYGVDVDWDAGRVTIHDKVNNRIWLVPVGSVDVCLAEEAKPVPGPGRGHKKVA